MPTEWPRLTTLRSELSRIKCRLFLQWVPGHCGLVGNEWADHEANRAAGRGQIDDNDHLALVEPPSAVQSVSWNAARFKLRYLLLEPGANHSRVRKTYDIGKEDIDTLSSQPYCIPLDYWTMELSDLPQSSASTALQQTRGDPTSTAEIRTLPHCEPPGRSHMPPMRTRTGGSGTLVETVRGTRESSLRDFRESSPSSVGFV